MAQQARYILDISTNWKMPEIYRKRAHLYFLQPKVWYHYRRQNRCLLYATNKISPTPRAHRVGGIEPPRLKMRKRRIFIRLLLRLYTLPITGRLLALITRASAHFSPISRRWHHRRSPRYTRACLKRLSRALVSAITAYLHIGLHRRMLEEKFIFE